MTEWLIRIFKSFFALPLWVIVWIAVFLIPVNMAGLFYFQTDIGFWVTLLGAGALVINTVVIFINGGFSRVLAIPHLLMWAPLVIYLALQIGTVSTEAPEWWLWISALVVNAISLPFDVLDFHRWWHGERQITGFESEPVRL